MANRVQQPTPTHPQTCRRFWEQVTKLILQRTRFGVEIIIGLWAPAAIGNCPLVGVLMSRFPHAKASVKIQNAPIRC
jgi:hypothetical protein